MLNRMTTALAVVTTALAMPVQAITVNFTSDPYNQIGSGFGNVLDFYNDGVEVTAWATTGVPTGSNSDLNDAQVRVWSSGLGSCNRDEGVNCGSPQHQVDNVGDDDLMLFVFDRQVEFTSIIIDPYGEHDRDVSFWIADLATPVDLAGWDPFALLDGTSMFGTHYIDNNSIGTTQKTIPLLNLTGNALLVGGKLDAGNKYDNDFFKIKKLNYEEVQVIPVPAAVWLFGSGLLGLVGVARRRA